MTDGKTPRNGDKSFSKLFDIIEQIAQTRDGLKGNRIAALTGNPVSTTFRMLKFMTDRNWLLNQDGRYTLGPGLVRLGALAQEQNPLQKCAHAFLTELADRTMETVHLAVLRGAEVCYLDKVEGRRSVRMASLIGSTAPVYCTGVGKAVLAYLPETERREIFPLIDFKSCTPSTLKNIEELKKDLALVRRRGYALDNCEHEPGVCCIAAPILSSDGCAVAGISVSGSELYFRTRKAELARLVRETADGISAAFSGRHSM